jgi:hypothetical protein
MTRRRRNWLVIGALAASVGILIIGWVMNDDRWREGPVEFVLYPGRGLHRMDVIMLALAVVPWLGILAVAVWPKRRR